MEGMSVHEMCMKVAIDDLKDYDMLKDYAARASSMGDMEAAERFKARAHERKKHFEEYWAKMDK